MPHHRAYMTRRAQLRRKTELHSPVELVRRRRLRALGKKGKANKRANATMAKEFKGHQFCEGRFNSFCTGYDQLTWAHNAKRRKRPNLTHAALLCRNCHDSIEHLPPAEMMHIVDSIVANRPSRAVITA